MQPVGREKEMLQIHLVLVNYYQFSHLFKFTVLRQVCTGGLRRNNLDCVVEFLQFFCPFVERT